jgi:hypothetical protein
MPQTRTVPDQRPRSVCRWLPPCLAQPSHTPTHTPPRAPRRTSLAHGTSIARVLSLDLPDLTLTMLRMVRCHVRQVPCVYNVRRVGRRVTLCCIRLPHGGLGCRRVASCAGRVASCVRSWVGLLARSIESLPLTRTFPCLPSSASGHEMEVNRDKRPNHRQPPPPPQLQRYISRHPSQSRLGPIGLTAVLQSR